MKTLLAIPFLLLATLASPVPAAATPAAATAPVPVRVPGDVRYPLRLDVDAAGAVVRVDSGGAVPDTLRQIVETAAARARFEPALRDGRPVPARVTVTVRVGFEAAGERVRARVAGLTAGGGVKVIGPDRLRMLTRARGYSGDVWVRVAFDAQGRVVWHLSKLGHVVMRPDPGVDSHPLVSGGLGKRFRRSVKETMEDWTWTPDEIDGQPIAGTFDMPVGFPSARAQRDGHDLAPGTADATFVAHPGPGLRAARLLPWTPATAGEGAAAAAAN